MLLLLLKLKLKLLLRLGPRGRRFFRVVVPAGGEVQADILVTPGQGLQGPSQWLSLVLPLMNIDAGLQGKLIFLMLEEFLALLVILVVPTVLVDVDAGRGLGQLGEPQPAAAANAAAHGHVAVAVAAFQVWPPGVPDEPQA